MEEMTDEELSRIEAFANGATAGPWIPKHAKALNVTTGELEHHVRSTANGPTVAIVRFVSDGGELGEEQPDRDATFIAQARAAIPALIAEIRRLRDTQLPQK